MRRLQRFIKSFFFLYQGSPVFKVTAIDQDTGVNDAIIYTIEGQPQPLVVTICCLQWVSKWEMFLFFPHCLTDSTADGLFEISRDSGQISVSSAIDREVTGDTVTLTVKVQLFFFSSLLTNNILYKYNKLVHGIICCSSKYYSECTQLNGDKSLAFLFYLT